MITVVLSDQGGPRIRVGLMVIFSRLYQEHLNEHTYDNFYQVFVISPAQIVLFRMNPGQLDTGQLGTGHLDTGQLGTGQLGTHESGKVGQLDTSI